MKVSGFTKYVDLKLVLILAGFYALLNLVQVIKSLYIGLYISEDQMESLNDFLFLDVLVNWVTGVIYMILIAVNTQLLVSRNYSWTKIFGIHTVLSILIGIVIHLLDDLYKILMGDISIDQYIIQQSIHEFMFVIDMYFLTYFAMISIIYTYYYVKKLKRAKKERTVLENQLIDAREKMLSSQLQPHFLFNTLNSISILVDMDSGKAKDTIADLSDFLRESLYSSYDNEVSLDKELRTLEYYLNILNVRFSDQLQIIKEIDKNLLSAKVPAMLLQPLIENSIKHGFSYDHPTLEVLITILSEKGQLIIKVENNGEPISLEHSELFQKRMGLLNIRDRLQNLYGQNHTFVIKNKRDGGGVETVIKIPKR